MRLREQAISLQKSGWVVIAFDNANIGETTGDEEVAAVSRAHEDLRQQFTGATQLRDPTAFESTEDKMVSMLA